MRVTLVANVGDGFADSLEVAMGTTVGQLIDLKCGANAAEGRKVTLNQTEITDLNTKLQDKDKVAVLPQKYGGA